MLIQSRVIFAFSEEVYGIHIIQFRQQKVIISTIEKYIRKKILKYIY
jgi:hypothetical protein